MTWIATGTPDRRRWVNLDHVATIRATTNGDLELIAPDGRTSLGVTSQPIPELPPHKHPRKPPRLTITAPEDGPPCPT